MSFFFLIDECVSSDCWLGGDTCDIVGLPCHMLPLGCVVHSFVWVIPFEWGSHVSSAAVSHGIAIPMDKT